MIEKIPNWLRYILAIPFGLLGVVLVYFIGYFSNLYVASPDSIMIKIYMFIYQNGANVLVFFTTMNYMLPKDKFKFTITISTLIGALLSFTLGIALLINSLTFSSTIGLILFVGCLIYECYITFQEEYKDTN